MARNYSDSEVCVVGGWQARNAGLISGDPSDRERFF
jgi:hypothetical protein